MTEEEKDAGWFVELDGECMAVLTDPKFHDMFWESFDLKPVVSDPVERVRICTDRKWWMHDRLVFRNRLTDGVAEKAFAAGDVFTETGRVIMRALYVP